MLEKHADHLAAGIERPATIGHGGEDDADTSGRLKLSEAKYRHQSQLGTRGYALNHPASPQAR
jgi:hypothetical protein